MKQYNLNTKYGRKKAREQAAQNYQNMNSEQRVEQDTMGCLVIIAIIIIVAIFIYASGGNSKDLLKWLSH